jgi:CRP-like cAMP-binding protein
MKFDFEIIHQYYRTLELDKHHADVEACAEKFSLKINEPLVLNKGSIYFVSEGVISLAKSDDPRIIGTTIENMPIGLLERFCPIVEFNYVAMTSATVSKISMEDFDRIFFGSSPENMKELATILTYMLIFILDVHVERRLDSGYHTIKAMMQRYLYRRTVNIDETEGIANFIIRRTNLSRSYVFRVLAELKEGEYITVKKGKLVSIDRKLPEDY